MIPVLDVSRWRRGDFRDVDALRTACEAVGFFVIEGHGVPAGLDAELERLTRAFFALPLEQKLALAMARGGRAWRGYFPVGGELTSGVPDLKEGLYLGAELGPDDERVRAGWPLHGANLFPDEVLPALRPTVLAWQRELEQLGQVVMRGLAVSLGLGPDFFERSLTRSPLCLFRLFHYPAPAPEQSSAWGVGEHTDYGLLTLLKQDDCGGLEVKTRTGWQAVPPTPGAFVCNLGDMLDRLTGGRYRSTPHRVRNTAGRSRYSWPFFFDPGFDAEVKPLPGASVRPAEQDAAERWDRASVHTLSGTYGAYLTQKVSRVFPELGEATLRSGRR
ncbi:MAG: isopenicillin N synthase family oxygenase [Myxococcaceae bacterium]|jgi:isopenicillin N synthase-like dioxygenase|nr:isopenicillin N synthase family oxygenase [Myxococcaceae bacterium]